jgi:hypothetical protein
VNNIYDNEEMNLNPPDTIFIDRVVRSVLADKPRITKFNINWDSDIKNIPSYNNYNFMFGDLKNSSENFENNLFINQNNNNINNFTNLNNFQPHEHGQGMTIINNNDQNPFMNTYGGVHPSKNEEEMKNYFFNMNNNLNI